MENESDMDTILLFIIIVVTILIIQLGKIFRYLFHHYFTNEYKPKPNQNIFIPLYQDDWEKTVKNNICPLNPTKKETCSICLESFTKQKITSFPICGKIPHLYCQNCILEYGKTIIKDTKEDININCPLCKKTIWTTL